ncbi:6-phospho-3-hexuloisomerase [Tetragenococcus halophilus]|uniref:6-phospho-3-hexuloisomerase n=1 Tax=Tetragenococcus halophilus TaxID=51669 RepID=UPI0025B20105|nr:6-phospho-3-hexuloisomerase [Tetragenococcus halophilus]WJS82724.1 SIS domain-containing protein [Tetragenococcus halophilus]
MDNFQKLSKNALDELSQVFAKMNDKDVKPLLDSIEEADRIFLLGAGREGLSTREFAMRLMHLGKEAHWVWEDTTPAVRPGDLFICACGSADVSYINTVCDNAKQADAKLLLVTPSSEGHLLSIADIVIKVPAMAYKAVYHSENDYVPTNQMMGNQFEQALLIFFDVIVMMLKDEMGLTNEDMEARHRNVE